MKKLIFAAIVYLSLCFSAYAETSLWQVQRGASVTYIGGTCHVLRPYDYPLPIEFARAYEDSEILVFETRIDKMNSPETQAKIIHKGMYEDGMGLDKALSVRPYNSLKAYCEDLGVSVTSLNRFKPSIVVLTLIGQELKRLGASDGVDNFFFIKATRDQKKIDELESVDDQIRFILSMGKGGEDEFIEHSIRDLKKTRNVIDQLIAAWKRGQEDELYDVFVAEMKAEAPGLYETLLVERNRQWLPKIERFVQTPGKELVLVGVGHLVGQDGIIEALRSRGYKVKKFTVH